MTRRDSHLPEPTPRNLNEAERRFWEKAFLAAELPALLKANSRRIAPIGAAHLAAEYADAAVIEWRRRAR